MAGAHNETQLWSKHLLPVHDTNCSGNSENHRMRSHHAREQVAERATRDGLALCIELAQRWAGKRHSKGSHTRPATIETRRYGGD